MSNVSQDAEVRLQRIGPPSTELRILNEQILEAKTARQDAEGHKHYFKKLDQVKHHKIIFKVQCCLNLSKTLAVLNVYTVIYS